MRLLRVFIPHFRRTFTYRGELSENTPLGSLVLVRHKKSYRLGILVEVLGEAKGSREEKVVGFLRDYSYPSWLFKLKEEVRASYFLSDDEFYADFLKLDRFTEHLKLEVVLVLPEPNPYFRSFLKKIGEEERYPFIISQEKLEELLGSKWTYYKRALLSKGAKLSFKLSERPGYFKELKRIISWHEERKREGKAEEDQQEEVFLSLPERDFWFLSPATVRKGLRLIRTLAETHQVILVVPERVITSSFIELLALPEELILHPYQSESKKLARFIALSLGYPMVVIGTGDYLTLPFKNLKLILFFAEGDSDHVSDWGPRFNWRELGALIARESGAKVIFSDILPSLETYLRLRDRIDLKGENIRKLSERFPAKVKLLPPPMRFKELLTNRILEEIDKTLDRGENALIFNYVMNSKTVHCEVCGYKPLCPRCGSRLKLSALRKGILGSELKCMVCGYREELTSCPSCGSLSWRVAGISLKDTYELLRRRYKDLPVFFLDQYFQRRKSALELGVLKDSKVIIGSKAAAKLPLRFGVIVILSLDSFFWVPSVDARFNTLYYLLNLLARLTRRGKLIIVENKAILSSSKKRTRERGLIEDIMKWLSDLEAFYLEELDLRRSWKLPPEYALLELTSTSSDLREDLLGAVLAWAESKGLRLWLEGGEKAIVSLPRQDLQKALVELHSFLEGFQLSSRNVRIRRLWEVVS